MRNRYKPLNPATEKWTMPELRIGCSGFSYQHWRGIFYPEHLAERRRLGYYSSVFSTVELNVTFYRLPRPATFDLWYKETPPEFGYSVKGSRFITHVKKLLSTEAPLKLFFDNALRLQEKLKVILWQLPPTFKGNKERLAGFIAQLEKFPVRNAFEFRHASWIDADVMDLCRDHNVSVCMADWPGFIDDLPLTADFVYIRRHGEGGSYATLYSTAQLNKDAARIRRYLKDWKDVFIYFNNDAFGYAPRNARELMEILK
jgi:uncharacterized protein YecE (DUF72 family)